MSVALGFVASPSPLAVIKTLLPDLRLIKRVELADKGVDERIHSDWLFRLLD